ncbi:hypothetical protein FYK26_24605 (plasmid) [Escherichia albertii]|nr:hypothetical protein [Escherichia albertii]QSZ87475.1 hypothetical protein FYK30_24585 [Escherichia albertii]QSZ91857.1 hypothetical protein FYK29_24590 [Escherichia albertii]QSZ96272.1 hypothetical protein FYK28_24625 [Escherichia albertii]QTA00715.1 hypothetical protein FYK27_25040 [Escherichia albertii]
MTSSTPEQLVLRLAAHFILALTSIEQFKPDFARTLRPGWLTVPAADFDMLLTFKSSMTIIAWALLMVVVTL